MDVSQFLTHLRDVASSPYALIGYIVVVGAWVYVVTAQSRLKNILRIIKDLPESERANLLLKEYNTTPRAGLSAEQWIRARRHTLFFLASLAAILCLTILVIAAIYTKPAHREASLSLVDLLIKEIDEFPKLELKVRNNSDEVVFLKKAEISTLGHWDIPRPGMYPSAVPVSWTYDVKVPSNGVATYSISQEIKPNSVDRFEFSIGSDRSPYPFVGVFAYLISIKLVYNEDDKSVITPAVLLHIPASMELNASTQLPLSLKELEANKRTAQDLLKSIDGNTIIETGLVEAVKSWAEADLSKFKSE